MPLPNAWEPTHEAVWRENAPGTNRAITLRHPSYPYEGPNAGGTIPDAENDTLIDWAATYLRKVSPLLGLNAALGLADIFETSSSKFVTAVRLAWLRVHGMEGEPAPLDRSYWVTRYVPNTAERRDRTAVILAVHSQTANNDRQILGSRLGIRIIAHVAPRTAPLKAQITGLTCSMGLVDALALSAPIADAYLGGFYSEITTRSFEKSNILEIAGFSQHDRIFYDGVRIVGESGSEALIDMYLTVPSRPDEPAEPAYAVVARRIIGGPRDGEFLKVEKFPLTAHGLIPVPARVFVSDPASQAGSGNLIDSRPNRSPKRLNKYTSWRILAGLAFGISPMVKLHDDLDHASVKRSKIVDKSADETLDQEFTPLGLGHSRVNWFAATSAYHHARGLEPPSEGLVRGLFDTLAAFDLKAVEYFRFATLPLHVRHRGRIKWGGKDGKVVNAQVDFEGLKGDAIANPTPAVPLPIEVKYGLADVKRTGSRRQPLGIAADPRWCWHEAGHVLLGASTGALQFRFAHSAGDALAAILSDPESKLATHRRMRWLTFPWVYIHRRHDRSVFRGWSWSGRYHRPTRFATDVNAYPRKGYQSEQILSTTLFRLYRSLGGDTTVASGSPDSPFRRRAADYTAYLIMKAIRFMPQAFLVPLETPDQLVSALVDADRSTMPATFGALAARTGGWAHKVVRWAFEAQGLYATADPLEVVDAPGMPKDRDIFINDLRPDSEGAFPRGGYMPVSLSWRSVPNPPPVGEPPPTVLPNPPNPPLWHATANAIQVVGNTVRVEVSSRGPSPAPGVTVQVWWIEWPATPPDPPAWNNGNWKSLGTSAPQTVAVWPSRTQFGPFSASGASDLPTSPSGHRLLIVATATCSADPANTEASATLPCSTLATPIVDLVAGDNNVALRRHDIP
jgi:hypothetical protein